MLHALQVKVLTLSFVLLTVVHALQVGAPRIQILYDSSNDLHRDLKYHPENSKRIDVCVKSIRCHQDQQQQHHQHHQQQPIVELLDISPTATSTSTSTSTNAEGQGQLPLSLPLPTPLLTKAKSILSEIHTEELITSIETKCRASKERRIEEGKVPLGFIGYLDHDTFLTTESYDVCLRATAAWMYCVEAVLKGSGADSDSFSDGQQFNDSRMRSKITASMALTRPPGHHATKTLPNGFCLFNFAAAAAVYALSIQKPHSGSDDNNDNTRNYCNKVSIIDWDVHYGQGVSDVIKDYPNIRYVSMHQVPAFPYQGQSRAISGEHKNIKTVPMAAGSTWTCGYEYLFREEVLPFCYNTKEGNRGNDDVWEADLIIVCAGYDALSSDELASCSLNAQDYGKMTTLLRDHIGHNNGKDNKVGLMFGLEGGYQLRDNVPGGNLADAVLETIKAAVVTK